MSMEYEKKNAED